MKLIHGDCIEKMKDIPDRSVDMCLTDPPYGTTACKWDSVIPFEPMWKELKRIVKPNGAICLFGSEPFSSALRMSNIKMFKYDWVWNKNKGTGHLNAKKRPLKKHEIISIFSGGAAKYYPQKSKGAPWRRLNCLRESTNKGVYGKMGKVTNSFNKGDRYPLSIIDFNRVERTKHPTQKPVPLLEYLIKTYTLERETVLDFTMGSGSTGVACVNTGRDFIGIEQDENYFQIAQERIQKAQEEKAQELF